MDKQFYTTAEAGEVLGIQARMIRRHIEEGRLAAQKYGRDFLITYKALEHFKQHKRSKGRPGASDI